jgi:hypothetical protein
MNPRALGPSASRTREVPDSPPERRDKAESISRSAHAIGTTKPQTGTARCELSAFQSNPMFFRHLFPDASKGSSAPRAHKGFPRLPRFACAALRFASPFPLSLRFVPRVGDPPPLALATPRLRQEAFGMYVHAAARFKGKGSATVPQLGHRERQINIKAPITCPSPRCSESKPSSRRRNHSPKCHCR